MIKFSRSVFFCSMLITSLAASADPRNLVEILKDFGSVNHQFATSLQPLTALSSNSGYVTGSFGDPNFSVFASPEFLAQLSESAMAASNDPSKGPLVRQALSLIISKTSKLVVALRLDKDNVFGSQLSNYSRTSMINTYEPLLNDLAGAFISNVVRLDPEFAAKIQDQLTEARARYASGDRRINVGEYIAFTQSSGWWSATRPSRQPNAGIADDKDNLGLLLLAAYSKDGSITKVQSRALRSSLSEIMRDDSQPVERRILAAYCLLQYSNVNTTLLTQAIALVQQDTTNTGTPMLYKDLNLRAINDSIADRRNRLVSRLIRILANHHRGNPVSLLVLASLPATTGNCELQLVLGH